MSGHDDDVLGCVHAMARGEVTPMLRDPEGHAIPERARAAGPVVDAHVHLFPERVFEAIWRWFDKHAWEIRYRLHADAVLEFLSARGVSQVVGLCYSHAPGMARVLNAFMRDLARAHGDFVIPLGTVLPGEPDAGAIAREALGPLGMRGLKLHCHVQKTSADDPRLDEVYAACAEARKPVVIHAGRAPYSPAYGVDTYALCEASRIERVLQRFPKLTVVVPHLGADEYDAYATLLDRYENLWLDTTMAIAGFIGEAGTPMGVVQARAERLLYGSDFPNVPYAWDRELKRLDGAPLDAAARGALVGGNARRLFGEP
jgi:predicted TIM-barrel fold metal-dependent hydrolase